VIFENRLKVHNVEKHYDSSLPRLLCQPLALQQVWTNLLSNALDALPERGTIEITTSQKYRDQQAYWVVEIKDNGHGIDSANLETIFSPNFTTKKEGNFGLGIGLSISQQIVTAHSGFITVDSEPGSYTSMQVWLPLDSQGASNE
jgi:signal transduction histidine kinase